MSPLDAPPILALCGVTQRYRLPRTGLWGMRRTLTAVDAVDLAVRPGQAIGLVGESGAGKTTLTRMLTGVERPASGDVLYEGRSIWTSGEEHWLEFRRSVQVVLQNPRSSLDPRMRVGRSLLEPLRSLRIAGDHVARVRATLGQVGLDEDALDRFPHEFSGGQLQRITIARALTTRPKVLIADEPVSALDVSIQAQILNLLRDLVADLGLGLVLIAHDLSVVAYATGHVAVMADGRIVDAGPPLRLFRKPEVAATRELVDAVLTVERGLAGDALS